MSRGGALLALLLLGACSDDAPPVDPLCEPGASRCDQDRLEVCVASGERWETTDCRAASSDGRCVTVGELSRCREVVCTPGETRCGEEGLTVERCAPWGDGWERADPCKPEEGDVCDAGRCASLCELTGASPQNVGCEFFPVVLDNNKQNTFGVVASNPNPWPARVSLAGLDGPLGEKTVAPGELVTFALPPRPVLVGPGRAYDYAYHLTSTLPIAAYQFNPLDKSEQMSNDASLLLPAAALGKRYYVVSSPVTSEGASYLTIVGVEEGTQVTITSTVTTQATETLGAISAGVPFTTTVGRRDLLQLASGEKDADPTGTKVEANKPVAVFGGNGCVFLPAGKVFCDHLEEQLFPVETWGKSYIAVKFMPRGQTPEQDWWRIMAAEDDTVVTLSGAPGLPTIPKLSAGEHVQIETASSFVIEASKPISVAHYLLSESTITLPLDPAIYTDPYDTPWDCQLRGDEPNMGDPALSLAVPFEQYRERYIFLTPDTYAYDFVTVTVAPSEASPTITLDGAALPAPLQPIGSTGFRFARFRVTDGPHRIEGTVPFGIEVYGYDCRVSYAYGGGLSLEQINPLE